MSWLVVNVFKLLISVIVPVMAWVSKESLSPVFTVWLLTELQRVYPDSFLQVERDIVFVLCIKWQALITPALFFNPSRLAG